MEKVQWPAWYYGPNGQAEVFESEALVPKGWVDHPSKLDEKAAPAAPTKVNPEDNPVTLDADGWPFDPAMHAATQSKTRAGLWRMKVGVSRPAPKPGFPAAPLDL